MEHEDLLPKIICVDCWSKTETFYWFQQRVIAAQSNFIKDIFEQRVKIEQSVDGLYNAKHLKST